MKHSELIRALARLKGFRDPSAKREQVTTPPEAAAALLEDALSRGDLEGRTVLDLGSGTGVLAIGAALLGAAGVTGVEEDATAIEVARQNATLAGVSVEFVHAPVESYSQPADTVLMNPPFGAQQRHADRPFWDAAFRLARRRVHAFALAPSRTFIARSAVARRATVEATAPVPWDLPSTFPHHRKRSVELPVDRWVLTPPNPP
jgi:putative methylase